MSNTFWEFFLNKAVAAVITGHIEFIAVRTYIPVMTYKP